MPSCVNSAAIEKSMTGRARRKVASLLSEYPLAVFDFDHHPRAVVETVVLLRSHDEYTMRTGDVVVLQCVSKRGAKFLGPGLCFLQCLGRRLCDQQERIVGVAAERRPRPLAIFRFVLRDVLGRDFL